jgi:hypothetical protein
MQQLVTNKKKPKKKNSKKNNNAGDNSQKGSKSFSGTITCWTYNKQGHYSSNPKYEKYNK